jgi:hypothetical protein
MRPSFILPIILLFVAVCGFTAFFYYKYQKLEAENKKLSKQLESAKK